MLKLFSQLILYLINKFLKYIKSLTFSFYKFNRKNFNCTILHILMKINIFFNYKIKKVKIIIQIFQIFLKL